jgi:hypothetical protein
VYSDCDMSAQYALMNLFDVLILNASPDFGALVYDSQAMLWLIRPVQGLRHGQRRGRDPGRFGDSPDAAPGGRAGNAQRPESAAFLSEYLHPRQLEALLERARGLRALD